MKSVYKLIHNISALLRTRTEAQDTNLCFFLLQQYSFQADLQRWIYIFLKVCMLKHISVQRMSDNCPLVSKQLLLCRLSIAHYIVLLYITFIIWCYFWLFFITHRDGTGWLKMLSLEYWEVGNISLLAESWLNYSKDRKLITNIIYIYITCDVDGHFSLLSDIL